MKDSLYALGAFTEVLIRRKNIIFTKREFFDEIQRYCDKRLLTLEIDMLFLFLVEENIFICSGERYAFRFMYWIYFFAAQRMYHKQEFADYILSDRRYAQFPEVIEFYSGIDRRRQDLLERLLSDLA